jgi:hypothetical protein
MFAQLVSLLLDADEPQKGTKITKSVCVFVLFCGKK